MSTRPTAPELARMLGRAHTSYEALTTRAGATCEWKKYTKNSPWVLRVSQGTRPLFYVKPDRGSFEVTVLLGPRATKAALGGRVAKALHPFIRSARVYPEGRPVRVVVRHKRDLEGINQLVDVKLHPEPARVRTAGIPAASIAAIGAAAAPRASRAGASRRIHTFHSKLRALRRRAGRA